MCCNTAAGGGVRPVERHGGLACNQLSPWHTSLSEAALICSRLACGLPHVPARHPPSRPLQSPKREIFRPSLPGFSRSVKAAPDKSPRLHRDVCMEFEMPVDRSPRQKVVRPHAALLGIREIEL